MLIRALKYCILFACTVNYTCISYAQILTGESKINKVIIDAGHGGHDPGVVGRQLKEKDVVLSIALKTGKLIKEKHPDVEVIYTREKDVFLEVHERSGIANKNNADLFISIHANSVRNRANTSVGGSETYIMGLDKSDKNMDVAKRENAVISYEDDYATKYAGYDPNSSESFIIFTLMQNSYFDQSLVLATMIQDEMAGSPIKKNRGVRQGPFLVLWHTAMPGVLVEVGFLSNPGEEALLKKEDTKDKIAFCIANAFTNYKSRYEQKHKSGLTAAAQTTPATTNTGMSSQNIPQSATTVTGAKPVVTTGTIVPGNTSPVTDISQEVKTKPHTPVTPATTTDTNKNQTSASTNKETVPPIHYSVQICALSTQKPVNAPEFKGLNNVQCFPEGKHYKYTVGIYGTAQQAQTACNKLHGKYPGAFVVRIEEGKIVKPIK